MMKPGGLDRVDEFDAPAAGKNLLWKYEIFCLLWDASAQIKRSGIFHPIVLRQDIGPQEGTGIISWVDGPSEDRVSAALSGLDREKVLTDGFRVSVSLRREYSVDARAEGLRLFQLRPSEEGVSLGEFMAKCDFYSVSKIGLIARYAPRNGELDLHNGRRPSDVTAGR